MPCETALLENLLMVGAMLFGVGMIGVLCRRNMIVMFLSVEIMLQGVSLSLVAWSRFRNDFGGQMLVLFIIAVAACEAAVALALIMALFYRSGRLDIAEWRLLREANQPGFREEPALPEQPGTEEPLPHLSPAGVEPTIPREELEHRPSV